MAAKTINKETISITNQTMDDYWRSTPIGSIDKAIGNNLFGINHTQVKGAVASNKDNYGLTFFVRPQLNMQSDNLRNVRLFYSLLSESNVSIQRYVRCMLDPRIQTGYKFNGKSIPALTCPLVDMNNAFIPVLSNNLLSISGWPDITVDTFTSKPGLYREVYSQVDGLTKNFEAFDLDATFRNTRGDPIIYMFFIWLHYMSNVFEGLMIPYLDFITENEIDYNTRIYRLVLDEQKTIVKKIAAVGVGYPISVPTGSFFDFNHEKPYNDQNREMSIRFKCLGVDYQDDILIKEFNDTVQIFNPGMRESKLKSGSMVKLNKLIQGFFNNRGYPRIDPNTNELEWWVDKSLYNKVSKEFANFNSSIKKELDLDVKKSGKVIIA